MFKDYDKYLSVSLKVYSFVLLLILILKIVGLDYFGMDVNNPTLLNLNKFIATYYLENIWYAISIYINVYIVVSITTNDNSRKLKLFMLCWLPLLIFVQAIKNDNPIFLIIDFSYMLIIALIYLNKNFKKVNLINYIIFSFINILFQVISIATRGQAIEILKGNFIMNFIYNLDYFIMLIIFYHLYFKKGSNSLWQMVVSSSSQRLISLKRFLTKLLRRSQDNKKKKEKKVEKTKEEKISNTIFLIIYLIWNFFTLFLIIFTALINDTVIECIFITFSFWVTKTVFGKAFHFESVIKCFIVSNLTYFILNKITAPLGISIFIPILLGVGLSYVTSKFVKKTYKPLYRGMPEELFNETISNVVDKDSTKYKICYDFYIVKESDISLSFKYNYSVPGIRKIKDRVNKKIEELNK